MQLTEPPLCQVEAETKDADADMTEQEMAEALSIGDVANQAEHKQQAYESNKRLKKSLQTVSSDKGMQWSCAKICVFRMVQLYTTTDVHRHLEHGHP